MKSYFKNAISLELKVDKMYRIDDKYEIEKIIFDITNSPYLDEFKLNQKIKTLNDLKISNENRADDICEMYNNFYINKALCNIMPNGEINTSQVRIHKHNYLEMIYVHQGRYIQYINGEEHIYNQGDVCILSKDVCHREGEVRKEDFIIYLCMDENLIDKELVIKLNKNVEKKDDAYFIDFKSKGKNKIDNIVENIAKEFYYKEFGFTYIIKGYINRIINELFNDYDYEVKYIKKENSEECIFLEIDEYIKAHLEDISRDKIAEKFFYTPNHVNRIIKQNTGQTYSNYIKDLKLQKSIDMILENKYSINEIINKLGYINKTYFYKIFTEKYNSTPLEYKEKQMY